MTGNLARKLACGHDILAIVEKQAPRCIMVFSNHCPYFCSHLRTYADPFFIYYLSLTYLQEQMIIWMLTIRYGLYRL